MSALHVAFYLHDLAGGGAERMVLVLAKALQEQGHRVSLLLTTEGGALAGDAAGLRVVVLGGGRTAGDLPALRRFVRAERPDALVSSLHHNNIVALLACLGLGATRLILWQHNALSAERRQRGYRAMPLLYRLLGRRADAVVAVCEGVAVDFAACTGIARRRIAVVNNPVIGDDFAVRRGAPCPHPWLAGPPDPALPVYVFAGRLVAQKDPATLLAAFALRLARGAARLVILGEGGLRGALEAQAAALGIAAAVSFAGYVAEPLPYVARAAALLLSSRHEGFGNVIVEALGCGTPVIATDCPFGPAEILDGGRFGRLVPVGDAAAMAAAMGEDLRAAFPAEALQRRAAEYGIAKARDGVLALVTAPAARVFGFVPSRLSATAIAARVLAGRPAASGLVVTPNIDHIRLLAAEPRFAAAYRRAEIVTCDGFPVAWYARFRGWRGQPRVTGCDIVKALLAEPARLAGQRVFAVADSEATAAGLHRAAHGVALATAVPPRGFAEDPVIAAALAARIAAFGTTLLLMGVGAPRSEIFAAELGGRRWMLCVGQGLRIAAGVAGRAPAAWQGLNAEWLWRLLHEPRRLGGRYLRAGLAFPLAALRDAWR